MRFKLFARLGALSLCIVGVGSLTLFAQSSSTGSVLGTVVGPDGAAIPDAHVTLARPDASARICFTAQDGGFSFNQLPSSGDYGIKVEAAGFAPRQQSSVAVAVGRTTHLTLRLAVAMATEAVTVSAAPVTFDTSQTSSVTNIDRDRVEELPIPSRNYLSFVLLSPQVAPANPALFQNGFIQSGGTFSFGGLRPGSNSVYLDQVNDNDEYSGGSRTELSPEAISDFQIVNHGFAAQSGGGAGGSIDVETRTGVNKVHGDAFAFVQNGGLNAISPLGLYPRRPNENRVRAGVALGGPIQRDKTFYYVAGEQEIAHGEDVNDLKPSILAAINTAVASYAPLDHLALQQGFFPTTEQETELSARLDRLLTPREYISARYAFTNARNANDAFNTDEQADRSARGSSFTADNSLNATLTSTLNETLLNSFSFELAQRRAVTRTGVTVGPGIKVAGLAYFGTPYSGNSRRFETHVEFADSISKQLRHHLSQFGARADHVALRAGSPDGSQGQFVFANLAALQNRTPDFFTQSFGNFNTSFAEVRLSGFAQDHWTTKSLTLDYGLRYDYNRLPSFLPQDAFNISPRFGFAWTPITSTVIRGGFGTFYDRFLLSTINRIQEFNGTSATSQILEDTAAAILYQSNQLPAASLPAVAPSVWRSAATLPNPYSEVASLSVEQSLPLQTTLTGEYQFVRGVHLGRTTNVNLAAPVVLTSQNAATLGVSSPTPQQLGSLVFSSARLKPGYDAINQFATAARSSYSGATVTLNRQFQDDLQIMVGYTYSRTSDDASSDLEQPQNPYALSTERALSLQDQRNRLTLSGLWLIGPDLGDPADVAKNANAGRFMKALYGLEFAPIISIGSGFHSNPLVGLDSNREHIFPFAARPIGYGRNGIATPTNVNFDFRVLKMVGIRGGHLDVVAESFNILNRQNITELDPVYGTDLQSAPDFGRPIEAGTARRMQFSLDYEF
ncbi:MAG TPA: carboxypeptidase regulatory-like domain-containing protein [Bryocella sp.]|nr:carboxypeptidase regulatory-like domain-containing protein [Bryocella sp.]